MEWQPIETHGGDMTLCILFEPDGGVTAGWNGGDEGWFDWEGDPPARIAPTHWMPLPDPPR